MTQIEISRRAALIGAGAVAAWVTSPARALVQAVGAAALPSFIEPLIARMTLEEKAGQLSLMASAWGPSAAAALNPPNDSNFPQQLEETRRGELTGIFNGNGARMARIMQTAAMTESRMKIPLIFAADIIHGHRTIFPVPLAETASFEPELARRTAEVAAFEAAGSGIDWNFAPMVDIARDQRWGRGVEGAGEDVLLGMLFAAARVRGFQGEGLRSIDHMLATAKHFAAYGAAEAGLDYNTVDVSERTLREVYLPPFKAAFDAGALSTMAAFNELSGIPATGHRWLMTDLLRGEWGFRGFVVSDYTGDEEMIAHGYAKDGRDAARIAFLAGVDMSMQSGLYRKHLPELVRSGEVPQAKLDESVRRVLAMKAMLGLFEDPFRRIDERRESTRSMQPRNLALAREAGRKSIVMLKNDGDLLPLPRTAKIALIGPFASGQHDLVGPWTVYGTDEKAVDLATGVRAAVRNPGSVIVADGSGVEAGLAGGIEAAVAAARQADIVVLAIGEATNMSGEAQSRTEIVIPEPQQQLAEAVAAVGKPTVVVLKNGRALALEGAVANAPAILVTWFLGTQTGHAIADILFGAHGPSGRLPVSFPLKSGQQPYHYAHKRTGRPNPPGEKLEEYKAHFRGIPNRAMFPFGHGLTYGRIEYGAMALSTPTVAMNGEISITARVTNRGRRPATEVVQLYVHDRTASVTRPVRELKAFRKVPLAPGESETIRFVLRPADLSFIGTSNRPVVEPGTFDVWIAPSAEAEGVHGTFELRA